jgi:hypothetical protein
LKKWRLERGWDPNNPTRRIVAVEACEHIVVLNKRDLVPEWGMEVNLFERILKASVHSLTKKFMRSFYSAFSPSDEQEISPSTIAFCVLAPTTGHS